MTEEQWKVEWNPREMGLSSTYRGVRELQGSYCVYILKNIGLLKKKKKKKKKKKTPRCPTISNKKQKQTNKETIKKLWHQGFKVYVVL